MVYEPSFCIIMGSSSKRPFKSILYLPGFSMSIVSGESILSTSDLIFSIIALRLSSSIGSIVSCFSVFNSSPFSIILSLIIFRISFGFIVTHFPDLSKSSLFFYINVSMILEVISLLTSLLIVSLSFSSNGCFVKKNRFPPQSGHPFNN